MADEIQGKARPLFSAREGHVLRAIQLALIPEGLMPAVDIPAQVAWMFADAKTAVRAGIRLAVWAFEFSPVFTRRARFTRLSPEERVRWLAAMLSAPKPGIRGLAAILKVLVYSTTYASLPVLQAMAQPTATRPETVRR